MPAAPQAPWENPRILFTLLLVFLCGALAGSLVMRYGFRSEPRALGGFYRTESGREISIDRLRTDLKLSPQQTKDLELIVDDFTNYVQTTQAALEGHGMMLGWRSITGALMASGELVSAGLPRLAPRDAFYLVARNKRGEHAADIFARWLLSNAESGN